MGKPTLAYRVLTNDRVKSILVNLLKSLIFLFNLIGEKASFRLASFLGGALYLFARKTRASTLNSIRIVFPDIGRNEAERIAKSAFVHQTKTFVELLRYPCLNRKEILRKVRISGIENLRKALLNEKGVILLVPHLGNWEILGATLGLLGYNVYSFFLDARIDSIGELLNSFRESKGIKLIARAELKKSVKVLKNNALLGVIADQDGGENGVYTDFFGKTVSAPRGPASLARRTGATVLPMYVVRNIDDTYTMVIQRPIFLKKTSGKEEDINRYTREFLRIYEKIILQFPEQWLWMYDRWKERRHVAAYIKETASKNG